MKGRCVCGCGKKRGLHRHHVVYQQELRAIVRREAKRTPGPPDVGREMRLIADPRNIVWVGFACHSAHHNRSKVLPLRVLPDSAFEFAAELMGAGAAYEYLRRRYGGRDPRLDALVAGEVIAP